MFNYLSLYMGLVIISFEATSQLKCSAQLKGKAIVIKPKRQCIDLITHFFDPHPVP